MSMDTPLYKQICVVTTVIFTLFGDGMILGITSSMLPALQAPDSPFKTSLEQQSWISAVTGFGCIMMYIISIYLMAVYGRKITIRVSILSAIIGHFICYFSANVNVFIFGRFLKGAAFASAFIGAIIIGECASPQYRGVFINFKTVSMCFGIMTVHILGHCVYWRNIVLINTFVFIIAFASTFTWPESPYWLASRKKYAECARCFYVLRGKTEQSTQELTAMITSQKEQPYDIDKKFQKNAMEFIKKFTKMNFLKPLFVFFFAAILLEVSGKHIIPAYALKIIYEIDPDRSKGIYYTLGIDMVMSVCVLVSIILVKVFNRRTLLFYSGISSLFVLSIICVFNYLQSTSVLPHKYRAIPIYLLGLNFGIVHLGCIPISYIIVGELFPLEHRPTAVAMSGIAKAMLMSLLLKITPLMIQSIKLYGTFTVYGIIMAICLIVLYYTLPETRNKTLQEIEIYFCGNLKKSARIKDEELANFTADVKM